MTRKRSVLYAWCFSYGALLLVMVLMCVALGRNVQRQLVSEYKSITQTLQRQTGGAITEYFSAMERSAYELSSNYLITDFVATRDPRGSKYYTLKPIQEMLSAYALQSGEEVERYLYMENIGRALTSESIHTREALCRQLCAGTAMEEETFAELLRRYHFNETIVLPEEGGGARVMMLTSVPLIGGRVPQGVLIQKLNAGVLEKLVLANTALEGSTTVLLDTGGTIICAAGSAEDAALLRTADLSLARDSEIELGGAAYWCQQEELPGTGWTLATVMPMARIQEKSSANLRYAVPVAVAMVVGAALLSLLFLYMNYRPLSRLGRQVAGRGGAPAGNEYEQLGHAFRGMQDSLAQVQLLQRRQTEQLREEFLSSCLEYDMDFDEAHLRSMLEHLDMRFVGDLFIVVLLEVRDGSAEFGWPDTAGLRGLLADAAAQADVRCESQLLPRGQRTILLLNLPDEAGALRMRDVVHERLRCAAIAHPEWDMLFACGRPRQGFERIRLAYLDACELWSYQRARAERAAGEAAAPADAGAPTAPRFSAEQEGLLMRYILAGSCADALGVLELVTRHNLADDRLSLTASRCLACDVLCGIAKFLAAWPAVWQAQQAVLEEDMRAVRGGRTRAELAARLTEAVRRSAAACEAFNRASSPLKGQPVERVMRCVEAHFRERDFNVSRAAEYLDMNVTYLSKLFKTHTGIGLLNYISGLRVNYAKECMASRHMNVAQAAHEAGFENANTFIRIFKRYEGVTPGSFLSEQ